jgi:hypothetical protein
MKKDGQNVLMSTIDWAAEQLKNGRNLDEAVNNLKFRATELMNSNRIRKLHEYKRRIAFVGVGFKEVEKGGKRIRIPLRIMVENFIDDDGSMMDQPRDEFKDHWDELKKGDVALYVAGTPLAEKKRIEITRFLKRLVQHGASPENIGVVLHAQYRKWQKQCQKMKELLARTLCASVSLKHIAIKRRRGC